MLDRLWKDNRVDVVPQTLWDGRRFGPEGSLCTRPEARHPASGLGGCTVFVMTDTRLEHTAKALWMTLDGDRHRGHATYGETKFYQDVANSLANLFGGHVLVCGCRRDRSARRHAALAALQDHVSPEGSICLQILCLVITHRRVER